jgi:hypothetical protein
MDDIGIDLHKQESQFAGRIVYEAAMSASLCRLLGAGRAVARSVG